MSLNLTALNYDQKFPLEKQAFAEWIGMFREDSVLAVRPEGIPVLYEIHCSNNSEKIQTESLDQLAKYLNNQLILCYQNGEGWYEIHPLIRENVVKRAKEMGIHG